MGEGMRKGMKIVIKYGEGSWRGLGERMEISKRELETLKKQCVVTSMLTLGNNVMVRFLSDEKPFASAKPCEAGVEDAYMYLMQERGGGDGCLDNYL